METIQKFLLSDDLTTITLPAGNKVHKILHTHFDTCASAPAVWILVREQKNARGVFNLRLRLVKTNEVIDSEKGLGGWQYLGTVHKPKNGFDAALTEEYHVFVEPTTKCAIGWAGTKLTLIS